MDKAIVCKLEYVRPHPNADRLQLASCLGKQVIVGLDNEEGQVGVFFEAGLQLSDEFATKNDLVGRKDLVTGERKGGFFAANRRVRAINLRGEKSYGFWCELDRFDYTQVFTPAKKAVLPLVDGYEFDTIGKHIICNKYINLQTLRARRRIISHRRSTRWFPMHPDTEQLMRNIRYIKSGQLIIITEKLHGTSHRVGYTLDEKELSWIERAINHVLPKRWKFQPIPTWTFMNGTRRVILKGGETGYYGDNTFRRNAVEQLEGKLKKGELVYLEIVGWAANKSIMPSPSTEKLPDIRKVYGNSMTYAYGMEQGQCTAFVYRIALTNEDGEHFEYPWSLVKKRCYELGMKYVPELVSPFIATDQRDIQTLAESLCEGASVVDSSHIREGVAIRAESAITTIFKHKSHSFLVLEGILQDKNVVDPEEVS